MNQFEFVSLTPDQGKFICGCSAKFKYLGKEYETAREFIFYQNQYICCIEAAEWKTDNILWSKVPLKLNATEKLQFLDMVRKNIVPLIVNCDACSDCPVALN